MMSVEIRWVSQCRVGLAPTLLDGRLLVSGGCGGHHGRSGAVSDQDRIPALAGADHCVQPKQDRRGDHSLGLGDSEFVPLTFGQVGEAGGIDGVRALGSPDRPAMPPVPSRRRGSGAEGSCRQGRTTTGIALNCRRQRADLAEMSAWRSTGFWAMDAAGYGCGGVAAVRGSGRRRRR
jgi:hypothetical protein